MAAARKIDVLTVKLDAKPGALAQVLGAFREAKVNVTASWGYQMGPGEAQAHFFTADLERARQALTKLGKTPKTEAAFWVEDADPAAPSWQPRQSGHRDATSLITGAFFYHVPSHARFHGSARA